MNTHLRLAAVALLVAACGGSGADSAGPMTLPSDTAVPPSLVPDTSPPATSTPTSTTSQPASSTTTMPPGPTSPDVPRGDRSSTVVVYFLDSDGDAVPVERTVTETGVAAAAVRALVAGPDQSERSQGLTSAFPADTLLLGLDIDQGTARVDLSAEFQAGGGSASTLGRLAQLVYTLTEFPSVERVRLLLDGRPVETFGSEGVVVSAPLTRADFTSAVSVGSGPVDSGVPTWEQSDLPPVSAGNGQARTVVLVAADDFLNVRTAAGAGERMIGRLLPGVMVAVTGETRPLGSSTWAQIRTPLGPGWVNELYLAPALASLPGDPLEPVAELAARMDEGRDLTDLVSEKGLWVAHHAAPIRFPRSDIAGLLDDRTTYRWGSNALEPGSPEIQPRTFGQAVAERFVDAYGDADTRLLVDQAIEGPNGRPVTLALPTELRGFPFVTVHDPGDEAQYGGLDWITWIVSLSYEDGELRVVGLTLDEWAP